MDDDDVLTDTTAKTERKKPKQTKVVPKIGTS
jgi:hypothetical protein